MAAAISNFLHGIEVIEVDTGFRSISTVSTSVIGIVGTAPQASEIAFPLNTPVLITDPQDYLLLGETGTLPIALDLIFAQYGAIISLIRVAEGADIVETSANVIGDTSLQTGINALTLSSGAIGVQPRVLIAPGFTHQRATGGVLSVAVGTQGSGYITPPIVTFAPPPAGGGLTKGVAVLGTGADAGKVVGVTISDPGSGYLAAPAATFEAPPSGVTALGITAIGTVRNRVLSNLITVAQKLRAIIIADCRNTNDAAAIQTATDFDSDRIFAIDPWVVYGGISTPSSPVIAGLISRSDNERGFWWSPSNQSINGIEAIARPIEFTMGDFSSRANILNANRINTIIQYQGGFRSWGNRTLASDSRMTFITTRRIADVIADSISAAHLWAIDRNISTVYIAEILDTVKAFLRRLSVQGAILGTGDVWADRARNSDADLLQGHITIDFSFTSTFPVERLTFRSSINTDGFNTIFVQ